MVGEIVIYALAALWVIDTILMFTDLANDPRWGALPFVVWIAASIGIVVAGLIFDVPGHPMGARWFFIYR